MLKRLKDIAGETLVETLIAVIVIVLALTMLAGAIVTAARVNSAAQSLGTAFNYSASADVEGTQSVTITHDSADPTTVEVTGRQTADDNKYQYYYKAKN